MAMTHSRYPHVLLALDAIRSKHPMLATMDFRVLKYFPFGETAKLDVVAEVFNLFNRANVAQINPVFGLGATALPDFLKPLAALGARRIQSSLDFEFEPNAPFHRSNRITFLARHAGRRKRLRAGLYSRVSWAARTSTCW
jgi:hypothetical protein